MSFNWSSCYPAENVCPPYCTLFSCDEIYGMVSARDSSPMYKMLRTIDACSSCSITTKCAGWGNITRTETSGAARSVKYAVEHCDLESCGRVYVDACSPYAKNVILTSIIAFIATTILGYFCIQIYQMYKKRARVTSATYETGTEIDVETIDDEEQTKNPVAPLKTEENASV